MIILDFETRSHCDLLTAGTANYVAHPSTDIVCMAVYNTETGYKEGWCPAKGPISDQIRYMLESDYFIAAHSAEFDQGIYEYVGVNEYDFPEIPRERWYCTMAQCRVNALPASLDDAAMALGLKVRKDHRGKQLIKLLSIPQEDGTFNEDPVLHDEFRQYCMQDVLVTAEIVANCRLMTAQEHADWLKTCEINERGIKVDLELAHHALQYAAIEQGEIGIELARLTGGAVEKHTQNMRIKDWLKKQFGELHPIMKEMTVYKNNVPKLSLDKNIRRNILEKIENGEIGYMENLDAVYDVILCLDEGNMSSVSKFKRMLAMADPVDERVRGAFVFAGATQTLRYTSRGVQLHNMKRDCWSADEALDTLAMMRYGGPIHDADHSTMQALAKLMRPSIIPAEGNVLIVGDWEQIEARCLHWLSDTPQGDDKLDVFADPNIDIYQQVADDMKLDDRQTGKVAELSCGYQGGYRALQHMARNYGVNFTEAQADNIVQKWRGANWWIVEFWRELERAAMNAVNHPGVRYKAGAVEYVFNPSLMKGTLMCIMPGDHIIQYPAARISQVRTPWGEEKAAVTCLKAGYHPKADAKAWPRAALYGGLLCENICQAFAAAILRNGLRQCPDVVAHVHDEIIMEVAKKDADEAAGVLRSIMLDVPDWAEGLPLNAEPVIMERYGK